MLSQVKSLIDEHKVLIFSKSYCPFCRKTKELLDSKGVKYHSIELNEVEDGAELHQALKTHSGHPTVPNVYIGGVHIGGNDHTEAAAESGKLKEALDKTGVKHDF